MAQNGPRCTVEVCCHAETMLSVQPATDELPFAASGQYQVTTSTARSPTSPHVTLGIPYEIRLCQIDVQFASCLQQQPRFWLATATPFVWPVWAARHAIDPPPAALIASTIRSWISATVAPDTRWRFTMAWLVTTTMHRSDCANLTSAYQHPGQELEFLPALHVVIPVTADHPVSVDKDCMAHSRPLTVRATLRPLSRSPPSPGQLWLRSAVQIQH